MDLLGNGVYKIGLGLWNYPLASYFIEALLLIVGLWIYLRATKAISLTGRYGMPILAIILLVLGAMSTFIMQTTYMVNFALAMLAVYFGMISFAFWLDPKRNRKTIPPTSLRNVYFCLSAVSSFQAVGAKQGSITLRTPRLKKHTTDATLQPRRRLKHL